eukprot:CAMPEP_0202696712 /NCGR_PEP_ID=MMETSP1385-20130828/10030_1 /ASSEMBLY_ACC=CAM_ASM_000861 /TAXON_ID=933848 /ORGANISM="Elphidium margaritaceum" /LENGTH=145 /DNA_ID=CAMNT_0049352965 /DNA_START=200 /DNA_END=634 /DNA_ORIENTATION=-
MKLQKIHSDSETVRVKKERMKNAKTDVKGPKTATVNSKKNVKKRHNSGQMENVRNGPKEDVDEKKTRTKTKTKKKSGKLKKVKENIQDAAAAKNRGQNSKNEEIVNDKSLQRKSSAQHLSPTLEPQISPLDPPRSPKSPKQSRMR